MPATNGLLRLLDAHLLRNPDLVDNLLDISPGLLCLVEEDTPCIDTALRVLVSLTNTEPKWCEKLVESDEGLQVIMGIVARTTAIKGGAVKVKKEEDSSDTEPDEDDGKDLDRLCLALGLITNLVQVVEKTKKLLRRISKFFSLSFILGFYLTLPYRDRRYQRHHPFGPNIYPPTTTQARLDGGHLPPRSPFYLVRNAHA